MCFREHCRRRRRWRSRAAGGRAAWLTTTIALASTALLAALTVLPARRAAAAPLDEPFVGGLSFSGPTSASLSSIYWNPAALGLVRGFQVMVAGSVRHTSIGVTRSMIDPTTGMPGHAVARDLIQPIDWPIGPGSFIGLSTDLGGDRFTLGFATYMPSIERITYPLSPGGTEPTRYHALAVDLRNLALVPALSIRFGSDLRIGFAPGFMFSTGRLAFAEDLALPGGRAGVDDPNGLCGPSPCGKENAAAAARYDIVSGHGLGDARFSVTLGMGIYFRRRSVEFGISYQTRPLGTDVPGVEVAGRDTTVTRPPGMNATGAPVTCANGQSAHCVFGDVSYRLPDVLIAGATWRIGTGLEVTGMARWLRLGAHDRIDVRVTGPTLDTDGIPQHVVLYRGFKDVWDTRLRVAYWWRERIRVGASVRFETSAVDRRAVNPAAVDAFKVQPLLLAEVRLGRRFWLGGGYGITMMPAVTVSDSVFNPDAAIACADAQGDLNACRARLEGSARPGAQGRYTRFAHDMGITLTARF